MEKILGIDTGTNSLGWAIVEKDGENYRLLDKGVNIFQEGVKLEKGIESSKAADRTSHRSIRVGYYRRKLRKIRLLHILSENNLCPPLMKAELLDWRLKKIYPKNELFMLWQSTDDKEGKNPYADRHRCLNETLNMEDMVDRYTLGRAFYHIAQRRGFLSNRKDQNGGDDGTVKEGISALTKEMHDAGYEYLGDYFYYLYNQGEKIRNHYTAREEHFLAEFNAICDKQHLELSLRKKIENAIFYQRPLKSQKGQVGHCVFEKNKTKCPASHPLYEEFRMLCFINNIKVRTPQDDELRPLREEEKASVAPLFYRKSKAVFDFEDIAKKFARRGSYGFYKQNSEMPYVFNYPMDASVAGCPVTASLKSVFGDSWLNNVCEVYTQGEGKTRLQILNDVWHALFFFSDETKLQEYAKTHFQLDEEKAKAFSKISIPSEYASLSLKAICKILPYLRRGMIYSHAVFLANLGEVMPQCEWNIPEERDVMIKNIVEKINEYDSATCSEYRTLEDYIKAYLKEHYNASDDKLKRLYHPSMMEVYPRVRPNDNGIYQLASPRISSVRNPMAMRSMFRLRKLVNRLLAEGKIDKETTIHIEFARELNDANKRKAIAEYVRSNQQDNDNARKSIAKLYKAETGKDIVPTDSDVLKYILWEEQGHVCLYTGKNIGIADFIGANPQFDIEHTVPQSVGGDSTRMNLTLCDSRFNRDVKGARLPSELSKHEEIMERVSVWKDKYEELDKQIRRCRTNGASTKEIKDKIIKKRHLLILKRDYWKGKYDRFKMTEVPEGFSRRQGTDIGIISKYARLYLKSVFNRVFTVKGIATSDFRKIWGVQELYSKKERVNHVHHCIDAIVIACIGPDEYSKLAAYYHEEENHQWYGHSKAYFAKPWPTFVEDLKDVENEILVSHYTPDNMAKQGKRRIMIGGRKVLSQGDAARGSLHNDTYYGAIERDGQIRYVKRIALSSMKESDVKNIVDDTVRDIVEKAIAEKGFKEAMAGVIWMNEEKRVPIRKVRCYTPSVTNPLHIRKQRDVSTKEYKRQYHVANDSNYMMALYIGKDGKGKEKRDFELVNMLQAAQGYKASNGNGPSIRNLVPGVSKKGYPLAYTLKIGTMVLLYDKTPDEIWKGSETERVKRLYKVTGLSILNSGSSSYARITMTFHEEARASSEFKVKNGAYVNNENLRPSILMLHTQIKALVQGYDFEINEIGEIKKLR